MILLEETSRCYSFDNVYSSMSSFAASIHFENKLWHESTDTHELKDLHDMLYVVFYNKLSFLVLFHL